MRVVVAPDSFKGSIRAADAAAALADGWRAERPDDELVLVPMADGGEGTLDAIETAVAGARRMPVTVPGPTGGELSASWLLLPGGGAQGATGVVELASTAGIELVAPVGLRPLDAGTRAFGRAVRAAVDAGVDRLVLAIGSSASSDGGAGMLAELGAVLTDADGLPIAEGARGLESLAHVDFAGLIAPPQGGAIVLSDVDVPLLGPSGAARMFAPQKGASPEEVERIEAALAHWALLVGADPTEPGSGAAGGTGYGLLAWGARLSPGAEAVADLVGLRGSLAGAALVITGEGRFDDQSLRGKAPGLVLRAAADADVPAAVVAGRVDVATPGLRTLALADLAGDPDAAMRDPATWLHAAGRLLAREHSA